MSPDTNLSATSAHPQPKKVTQEELEVEIGNRDKPIIIDFYAVRGWTTPSTAAACPAMSTCMRHRPRLCMNDSNPNPSSCVAFPTDVVRALLASGQGAGKGAAGAMGVRAGDGASPAWPRACSMSVQPLCNACGAWLHAMLFCIMV